MSIATDRKLFPNRLLSALGLAAVMIALPTGVFAGPQSTDLRKFNLETALLETGVEPQASGSVQLIARCSLRVDDQSLRVIVRGLMPNTTYRLTAALGADTGTTPGNTFMTDRRGAYRATYRNVGPLILPPALAPISNIRELDVVNGSDQVVLTADLVNADRAFHRVQVSMDNNGFVPAAEGELSINSLRSKAEFRLNATGLAPQTDYLFTVNGVAYETHRSNTTGVLVVSTRSRDGWPDAREIEVVALTDITGDHAVLTSARLAFPTECLTGPDAIVLGGAATFAVLAGAGITNTGFTAIEGDVGLSPGALSSITGFETATVDGLIYTADNPAQKVLVDQAKLDLTTAYNDAAGRSLNVIIVSDGELGGKTLAPGLYRSGISSFAITDSDLTLDAKGDSRASFIFQMPSSTFTVGNGRKVILAGNANAANIFWQVGTSATLGTTSTVEGTIMADQSIALQTGATLNGRALTRIAEVTMQANAISIPTP